MACAPLAWIEATVLAEVSTMSRSKTSTAGDRSVVPVSCHCQVAPAAGFHQLPPVAGLIGVDVMVVVVDTVDDEVVVLDEGEEYLVDVELLVRDGMVVVGAMMLVEEVVLEESTGGMTTTGTEPDRLDVEVDVEVVVAAFRRWRAVYDEVDVRRDPDVELLVCPVTLCQALTVVPCREPIALGPPSSAPPAVAAIDRVSTEAPTTLRRTVATRGALSSRWVAALRGELITGNLSSGPLTGLAEARPGLTMSLTALSLGE
jgi:hypothetical protein